MNLNYRQRGQLHRVEAGLRRADPHLDVMLGIFGRLYPDQEMPGWEQVPQMPALQSRLRRVGAWVVALLAAAGKAPGIWIGDGLFRPDGRATGTHARYLDELIHKRSRQNDTAQHLQDPWGLH